MVIDAVVTYSSHEMRMLQMCFFSQFRPEKIMTHTNIVIRAGRVNFSEIGKEMETK